MFSDRYGYNPQKGILYEEVSPSIRARVWNLFYQEDIAPAEAERSLLSMTCWQKTIETSILDMLGIVVNGSVRGLNAQGKLEYFLTRDCNWYEVFDFIEIHLLCLEDDERSIRQEQYNEILEREKSAYRVVQCHVVPITNVGELDAISRAIDSPYAAPGMHIDKALQLYADRKKPDYQNSVKESISAVEAMCCIITGLSGANATLNAAIKKLKDCGVHIHHAMERAFSALYGYTSDENGIRHGGIDFVGVPAEDAKYMLVTCSAFVNYLIEKWSRVSR